MSARTVTCLVVACDVCGTEDGDPNGDYGGGTPHFSSVEEAAEFWRHTGWIVVGDRFVCSQCAANEECARMGHTGDWRSVVREDYVGSLRWCDTCNTTETDPPYVPAAPTPTEGDAS